MNRNTCSSERPLVAILGQGGEVCLRLKMEKRDGQLEQVSPELAVGLLICFIGQLEFTFLLLKTTERLLID